MKYYFFYRCVICLKTKQKRLLFTLSGTVSSHAFDLINLDVQGPYHTPIVKDCRYFLTIIDDHSRANWTHLLSSNGNAFTMIKSFVSLSKNQFSFTVKTLKVIMLLNLDPDCCSSRGTKH